MGKRLVVCLIVGLVVTAAAGAAFGLHYWERHQARSDLDAVGISYSEANFIDEACAGNRAAVVLFLKTGMSPLTRGKDDVTALHCAARHGQDKLVRLLLNRGAEADARSKDGRSPLHEASSKGSVEVVRILLDAGAGMDVANQHGDTPLMLASQRKSDVIALLVERGANLKVRNKSGDTPLLRVVSQYGSSKEAVELVDLMLRSGAEINAATNDGRTVLVAAIGGGNRAVVEKLIAAGADVNAKGMHTTPLIAAAGRIELLRLLLDNKADPNLAADSGQTVLDQATRAGNLEAAKLLLDAGARVGVSEDGKDSPLHGAAANGNAEMIELLLMKGADASARGQGGRTPLHALVNGARSNVGARVSAAKLLLAFGAKTDAIDSRGQTPLQIAQQLGSAELIDLLSPRTTSAGTRLNATTIHGKNTGGSASSYVPENRHGSMPAPAPAPYPASPYPRPDGRR